MSHLSLSIGGKSLPLTALPAKMFPPSSAPTNTVAVGDFLLLVEPVSVPNWGDPVEMAEAGVPTHAGRGAADAASAPAFTNQPPNLALPDTSTEGVLNLSFHDPNACRPSFVFTPYDPQAGRAYPHCKWATPAERDGMINDAASVRANINAFVGPNIDFNLAVGRACANPPKPDGTPANPGLPGCPTNTKPCGNGCIPQNTACCNFANNQTNSYCTNNAGGGCQNRPCGGSSFCCASAGDFGSNDCAPTQHHCGLNCTSLDRPCCPYGSTDPACLVGGPVAGPAVAIGVVGPRGGNGGGGSSGGGGSGGGDCGYGGTYRGQFNYSWKEGPANNPSIGNATVTAVFKLEPLVAAGGQAILNVTSVQVNDPLFGATQPIAPQANVSIATLPCPITSPAPQGSGIIISFPNGWHLGTSNGPNAMLASNDGTMLSSSKDPSITDQTWTAGPLGGPDSNTPGSAPGGHVYNACKFTSWSAVKQ